MTTHLVYRVIELLAVPVLVLGCAAYCTLRLAPEMVSRWLRRSLLGLPLPGRIKSRLALPPTAGACGAGCSGCAARPLTPEPNGCPTPFRPATSAGRVRRPS